MAPGKCAGGVETQAFCYDDLDRLTWAGTQGTGPCGRTGASEGISGAGYTASYTYDALDRITTAAVLDGTGAPLVGVAQGSYSYDTTIGPTHLHGLSHVGTSGATSYAADYDAAGHQTCRSVGSISCASFTGPTGQQLGYDALGRLLTWQNASTSPTATGAYAYDGAGERIWQQDTSTSGSTTTTTTVSYILGDEVTSTAVTGQQTTTTATRYYPLPGGVTAVRDASGLSYVGSDLLGTPIATFNLDTGTVTGLQLRAPYGRARFAATGATAGGMHTTFGFTGQREDVQAPGSSGLAYFHARYYDPVVGRFTSADPVLGGDPLYDGYAYVGGMVTGGHRSQRADLNAAARIHPGTAGGGGSPVPAKPSDDPSNLVPILIALGTAIGAAYCILANCPSGYGAVEEGAGGVMRAPPPDAWGNDKDLLNANRFNRPPKQTTTPTESGDGNNGDGG